MRALLRRFIRDQRGNIAIMSAGVMLLVIGCAALGVDVGTIFADRRKVQSAADIAAIVAAGDLTHATAAATAAVTKNNYPSGSLVAVEPGVYTANAALTPSQRFVAAATPANAVRVRMQTQTPLYFGRVLTSASQFTINTTATATTTQMASFAIGSRLVSLNGGLLNALLGGMLGTTLNLSAMDYQSLIDAKIDAFDFMSALATRANLTGVTYDSLLNSNLKVSDVIAAMVTAQTLDNGMNAATTALQSVSLAMAGITKTITPSTLISAGPYSTMTVGQKPKTDVTVSAFDMLNATASLANGTNQIAANVNLSLPGIASVTLMATVGERPVGTSWVTVGSAGATVHTAQTRVFLQIQLVGSGSVSVVNLPVYVEIAAGTATLNAVSCGYPNVNTSSVQLGVSPGIVDAWIGNVTAANMTNFSSPVNPPAVNIVNLGIIQVSARAHATMANTSPTNVNFSYADIQAQTKKTVNTTGYTSSLTSSLLNDLSLTVALGPLGLPIPGIGPLVTSIISGATSSIDTLLASVLQSLGVGLGQADVWVTGVRCDGAVLVN
ncbi:MAG: hypothetical protein J0I29_14685 [Rhizobiales bacterium]|nr:hypothetical protein [Hyphomicrobiales bacterium]